MLSSIEALYETDRILHSELGLCGLLGSLSFGLKLFLFCGLPTVRHVLFHVQSGAAVFVDEAILSAQVILLVGCKGDHLLKRNSVGFAAAVEPETMDHSSFDSGGVGLCIIVYPEPHEVRLSYKLQLVAEVGDLAGI